MSMLKSKRIIKKWANEISKSELALNNTSSQQEKEYLEDRIKNIIELYSGDSDTLIELMLQTEENLLNVLTN